MSRQSDLDNHANQMNPNNDTYWESRGEDERPDDWVERSEQTGVKSESNSQCNKQFAQRQMHGQGKQLQLLPLAGESA